MLLKIKGNLLKATMLLKTNLLIPAGGHTSFKTEIDDCCLQEVSSAKDQLTVDNHKSAIIEAGSILYPNAIFQH